MSVSYLYVNYTPVTTPIAVPAVRGAKNFLAQDVFRGKDNLSTSGAVRERVGNIDVMVSFTLEAMVMGTDFEAWSNFGSWALQGGVFILAPFYNTSMKQYNCVMEAQGYKIGRAGLRRYSADFAFRILNDGSRPANAAEVMDSFWGLV